ncbi:MAG: type I-U CRISPR-associated protein Cas5/Cas6 [Methanocalculus sp. MSAO_Arc2]|uniref:type I-G CRISPR-associated protein Csb2 n=1 Tax=Methanocalculus sp. MSAO_Arc2 TaxID=2293855 RepID=UPI000FF581ED|nr:MAG: type I-U CRISPR-associated protein Cas5/Cas6 [Methanocalculus sp. MSAO_Arc2]
MLAIELNFLTGRFHATPWGRNVNEGVVEWPPSPYRLIRALYDVWKRKLPEWPEGRVRPLFEALASETPLYYLPDAHASHTRSFLSQNKEDVAQKQLVFDAFVVVSKRASIFMKWKETGLSDSQMVDLNLILSLLNYLGRSESWVEAKILQEDDGIPWNCAPDCGLPSVHDLDPVIVACPVPEETYVMNPFIQKAQTKKDKPKTLDWMDALAFSTTEMHKACLNVPPAFQYVTYLRSAECFKVRPSPQRAYKNPEYTGVIYALESKVTPPVTATIEVSERIHRKLMGIYKRVTGDPEKISPLFSGKDTEGRPLKGHQHIFVLPLDRDNDGWLDHLAIVSRTPFSNLERLALDRLDTIWQPDGKPDIFFVPLKWGKKEEILGVDGDTRFVSSTPFVPPRHYRKGRGTLSEWLETEVRREASYHGLPEPVLIEPLEKLELRNKRHVRWLEFRRNRKGDPDKMGYGFILTFAEPVSRPIALGYGAHFGLGHFIPAP